MKVRRILPAVFLLCSLLLLSACGKGAAGSAAKTMAVETMTEETTAGRAAGGDAGSGAEKGRPDEAGPGTASLPSGAAGAEDEAGTAPGAGQNEAVKEAAATETAAQTLSAFAERVQEACADRDLAALAELLAYPCQIHFSDGAGQRMEKKGDLLAVDPDLLFTDSLLVSIANVDTASLTLKDGKAVMGEGKSQMVIQISKDKKTGISEITISDGE